MPPQVRGDRKLDFVESEEPSGKSTGRAIQSSNYFPLPQYLTKPVQRNNYNNEKNGRYIVYPAYTQNTQYNGNNIDQTRRRYDQVPATGMLCLLLEEAI